MPTSAQPSDNPPAPSPRRRFYAVFVRGNPPRDAHVKVHNWAEEFDGETGRAALLRAVSALIRSTGDDWSLACVHDDSGTVHLTPAFVGHIAFSAALAAGTTPDTILNAAAAARFPPANPDG